MARLNEPPAAPASAVAAVDTLQPIVVETLDTQKRRFLRQNRELAKHNSCQSLRIRTLELDVSRLLAENLELRNQVLHLQNEVFTAQSQASTAAVQRIKDDLQAKIAELGSLVAGIDGIQRAERNAPTTKKPLEGNWRERQTLSDLMRESQMPTITEDKQYPRRTLNADEIRAIRLSDQSSNESPELGPPPIARFDYTDPVKNSSPLVHKVLPDVSVGEEASDPAAQLSINLETRRKRKDGQPRLEIRRHSIVPQDTEKDGESTSILRTGAKRKLADRDTDNPIKPPSKGDFSFSRKINIGEVKVDAPDKSITTRDTGEGAPTSPKPVRKILGEKSVNQSPQKTIPKSDKPEKEATATANRRDSNSTRHRRISSIPLPSPERLQSEAIEIVPAVLELPPKTPATLDLFSPTTSEPSTLKEAGRGDTPPPGDLSTLSMATDGGLRPSRRARSAVNYAEPSLISKMRRPDKKMVDAVTGLQDPRRAMSGSGRSAARAVVKKESVEDEQIERWKAELKDAVASSPLTQKSGTEELPTDRPVQPSSAVELYAPSEKPSNSSATISALVAASRKRRESSGQTSLLPLGIDIETATKKMEEMDIYEFKDSSSPEAIIVLPAPKSKGHRRHSSVPKDLRTAELGNKVDGANVLETRAARAVSRRRSMQL